MSYVDEVLAKLKQKNAAEPEFLQAAEEVLKLSAPGHRPKRGAVPQGSPSGKNYRAGPPV